MRNLANESAVRQHVDHQQGVVSIVPSGTLFCFTLDTTRFVAAANGLEGYAYQIETVRSGLYETVEEAAAAAEAQFQWVGTALSRHEHTA